MIFSILIFIFISILEIALTQNLPLINELNLDLSQCDYVTFYYAQRDPLGLPSLVKFDGSFLPSVRYNSSSRTIFLTHGFTRSCTTYRNIYGLKYDGVNEAIDPYLALDNGTANVFCIDWSPLAGDSNLALTDPQIIQNYYQVTKNTQIVGQCAAKIILKMAQNFDLDYSNIVFQGHSLGVYVMEHLGCELNQENSHFEPILPLLIGLDPAGILLPFTQFTVPVKCSKSFKLTQMIYTSLIEGSNFFPRGDVIFQINSGFVQPFCLSCGNDINNPSNIITCDHNLAISYMNEAVAIGPNPSGNKGFYGCPDFINSNEFPLMGPFIDLETIHGIYQVKTSQCPDSLGQFSEGNQCLSR